MRNNQFRVDDFQIFFFFVFLGYPGSTVRSLDASTRHLSLGMITWFVSDKQHRLAYQAYPFGQPALIFGNYTHLHTPCGSM